MRGVCCSSAQSYAEEWHGFQCSGSISFQPLMATPAHLPTHLPGHCCGHGGHSAGGAAPHQRGGGQGLQGGLPGRQQPAHHARGAGELAAASFWGPVLLLCLTLLLGGGGQWQLTLPCPAIALRQPAGGFYPSLSCSQCQHRPLCRPAVGHHRHWRRQRGRCGAADPQHDAGEACRQKCVSFLLSWLHLCQRACFQRFQHVLTRSWVHLHPHSHPHTFYRLPCPTGRHEAALMNTTTNSYNHSSFLLPCISSPLPRRTT